MRENAGEQRQWKGPYAGHYWGCCNEKGCCSCSCDEKDRRELKATPGRRPDPRLSNLVLEGGRQKVYDEIAESLWEGHRKITDTFDAAMEKKMQEWVNAGFEPKDLVVETYPWHFERTDEAPYTITVTTKFRVRHKDDPPSWTSDAIVYED